jgi:hypothetical protein
LPPPHATKRPAVHRSGTILAPGKHGSRRTVPHRTLAPRGTPSCCAFVHAVVIVQLDIITNNKLPQHNTTQHNTTQHNINHCNILCVKVYVRWCGVVLCGVVLCCGNLLFVIISNCTITTASREARVPTRSGSTGPETQGAIAAPPSVPNHQQPRTPIRTQVATLGKHGSRDKLREPRVPRLQHDGEPYSTLGAASQFARARVHDRGSFNTSL